MEWQIDTDEDVDVYVSGAFPESDSPIRVLANETFWIATKNRAITKIEMQAVSSQASVSLRPSIL